jgi:hypothetical protein
MRSTFLILVLCFPRFKDTSSFDLDLPIECDDEYWDNGFQQPSGKPSSITYFNSFLRLMDILAYAMRLIVSQVSCKPFSNHSFIKRSTR